MKTRYRGHHRSISTPVFHHQTDAEVDIIPEVEGLSLKIRSRGVEATATFDEDDLDWLLLELGEERQKIFPKPEESGYGGVFVFLLAIAVIFAAGFFTAVFW